MMPPKFRLISFVTMTVATAPTVALAAAISELIEPVFIVPPSGVGRSLCASDGWLFVGAQLDYVYTTGDQYVGRVAVFRENNGTYEQVAVLQPPPDEHGLSGEPLDQFGLAIDVSGDLLVIGAPDHATLFGTPFAEGHGKAFVYRLRDGEWQFVQELTPPDEDVFGFGWSVAVHGNLIAIGAPLPGKFGQTGSAFVYQSPTKPDGGFKLVQIFHPHLSETRWFGAAVDIDPGGGWIAVGDPGNIKPGSHNGAVQLYRWSTSEEHWLNADSIHGDPSPQSVSQSFGATLRFDGDTLVVGAPGENKTLPSGQLLRGAGSVSVYRRQGLEWARVQRVSPLQPVSAGSFGAALALRDDALIIGAPGGDLDFPIPLGVAYVYRFTGSQWDFAERMFPDDKTVSAYIHFGRAVAMNGSDVFLGDPGVEAAYEMEDGLVFRATLPWPADADGDGDCDLNDFSAFADCFNGPEMNGDPEGPCATFDLDLDGDVDLADMAARQRAAKVAEE